LHGTQRNNDYLTSVRQVENAGYWISRDTQMAQSVITDNLTSPDFILVNWTEWDAGGQPIYHSVRYFFENIITGNGELKRYHWSSAGANEETLIARHIFFDSDNITYTSKASYQFPMLALKLTASYENVLESREYKVVRRLNY
ncbi:MAG: hypothetical protein Q8Q07_06115, partial [Dehalococcoidales bacterium]|nr:hypothetical protein [Dehalococcoidales bacterium]